MQLSVLLRSAVSESDDHYLKYINLRFVHSTTITYEQLDGCATYKGVLYIANSAPSVLHFSAFIEKERESGGESLKIICHLQMFEHSQALHAHQQQRQSHPSHSMSPAPQPNSVSSSSHQPLVQRLTVSQGSSLNPSASQQVPLYERQQSAGGGITQQQLASALAGALGSVHSSSLSGLDISRASRYIGMSHSACMSVPHVYGCITVGSRYCL